MARPKLTKEAIAFIIECRDDPTKVNTWEDIANLVSDKFGIKVSFQAIAKNYQKYKDSIHTNEQELEMNTSQKNNQVLEPKKPLFKPKPQVATLSEPLFEKDEETDLKDYFN